MPAQDQKIQQTIGRLRQELDLAKQLALRERVVEDFLDHSDYVISSCNDFFQRCTNYLNARHNPNVMAPIQAWNGILPPKEEARRANVLLIQMMQESLVLLKAVTELRKQFKQYSKSLDAYLFQTMKLLEASAKDTISAQTLKKLHAQPGKMQGFAAQLEQMVLIAQNKREPLKSIEQKMIVLKAVR